MARTPPDSTRDGYDVAPPPTVIAAGVRAQISSPAGTEQLVGGDRTEVTFGLSCDPVDLKADDVVTDDTGQEYHVIWARPRTGLGLDHVHGQLRIVAGVA